MDEYIGPHRKVFRGDYAVIEFMGEVILLDDIADALNSLWEVGLIVRELRVRSGGDLLGTDIVKINDDFLKIHDLIFGDIFEEGLIDG